MLFHTNAFLWFFALAFVLYHGLGRRWRNPLLLVASYVFYGWWDWRFLGLLALSTVVDYTVARRMAQSGPSGRRGLLLVSLCVNLGILGFFKYAGFFVDSTRELLETLGFVADLPTLEILLPVGISFYTFQTLSYTIDVYRGEMEPVDDPVRFGVYVAYFPQLVAGPIERATHLLPILERPRRVTADMLASGAVLCLVGYFRKVVIADGVAPLVDEAFTDPARHGSLVLFQGAFCFGLQIYGDFAGYSGIARGISRMLGIELVENFRRPYLARSITDFWRRWHISLSSWLRDYLYIPLGGNRHGRWKTYRNLLLTMLLGGLWHGAAWTFVAWGGLHGAALAVHKLVAGRRLPLPAVVRGAVGWLLTMVFVWFCWIFFRAADFREAWEVVTGILDFRGPVAVRRLAQMALAGVVVLLLDLVQDLPDDQAVFRRWPAPVRGLAYALLLISVLVYWSADGSPFIYFQF